MKKLLLILVLLTLSCPSAWAVFTLVQHKANTACANGTNVTTCAVTVTSTGTGHVIVLTVAGNGFGTAGEKISSVSGGGTYSLCASSACLMTDTGTGCASSGGCVIDSAYTLSSTSGATSITVTMAQKVGSSATWSVFIVELSTTGTAVFDSAGVVGLPTITGSSWPGVALTLTGTNDLIYQAALSNGSGTPVSISSPYTVEDTRATSHEVALSINTVSGTAPTWTAPAPPTVPTHDSAIAIKDNAPASGASCSNFISLMGVGCQ